MEALASGDPFDSTESFLTRFDTYARIAGFDMVLAHDDGRPVGQTWGWPLTERAATIGWWAGLRSEPEPGFTSEDGRRTFALSEIMMVQSYAGRGLAHALHNCCWRPASSRGPPCWSNRTTAEHVVPISGGAGDTCLSCNPAGMMRHSSTC